MLSQDIKSYWFPYFNETFLSLHNLEALNTIEDRELDTFTSPDSHCGNISSQNITVLADECVYFREQSVIAYITRLYYLRSNISSDTYGEFDTTLLTMFTIDRVNKLIRLLRAWGDGPVIIIMYTTLEELIKFKSIKEFDALKNHHDLSMHVIFKAGVSALCRIICSM